MNAKYLLLFPFVWCLGLSVGAAKDREEAADLQSSETAAAEAETCSHGIVEPFPARGKSRVRIDYPEAAQRQRLQGAVGVRALIGCDGYAKDCVVTQSSGHGLLDDAACIDILKHARVRPASDANGRTNESYFETVLRYGLSN